MTVNFAELSLSPTLNYSQVHYLFSTMLWGINFWQTETTKFGIVWRYSSWSPCLRFVLTPAVYFPATRMPGSLQQSSQFAALSMSSMNLPISYQLPLSITNTVFWGHHSFWTSPHSFANVISSYGKKYEALYVTVYFFLLENMWVTYSSGVRGASNGTLFSEWRDNSNLGVECSINEGGHDSFSKFPGKLPNFFIIQPMCAFLRTISEILNVSLEPFLETFFFFWTILSSFTREWVYRTCVVMLKVKLQFFFPFFLAGSWVLDLHNSATCITWSVCPLF